MIGSTPSRNVSANATGVFGRREVVVEICAALDCGRRWVTLTGGPGVGKSTVARVVHRRGGSVFVDALPCTTVEHLEKTLIQTLGVAGGGLPSMTEGVVRVLSEETQLVIVDNLEQLVPDVGSVIDAWLDASPQLRILVASRCSLGGRLEYCIEVPTLELPKPGQDPLESPAVQLLIRRASDVGREIEATKEVAMLANLLEGNPLAIEVAAARLRVLKPHELLDRIRRRNPDSLSAAARMATIERSWNLLSNEAQTTLAQCSLFTEGFRATAAEAAVSFGNRPNAIGVLDALEELVHHRLITSDDTARLDMHPVIRTFAMSKLQRTNATYTRLLNHYVKTCASLSRHASIPEQRAFFVEEFENLLAACDFAQRSKPKRWRLDALTILTAMEPALEVLGWSKRVEALLLRCLDAPLPDPALGARAHLCLARFHCERAEYSRAEASLRRALEVAEPGDRVVRGQAMARLGHVQNSIGESGVAAFRSALLHLEDQDDHRHLALSHVGLAASIQDEDPDGALAQFDLALKHYRIAQDHWGEALTYRTSAETCCNVLERFDDGLRRAQLAVAQAEELHAASGVFYLVLGIAHHGLKQYEKARHAYEASITRSNELGSPSLAGYAFGYLGLLHYGLGAFKEAEEALQRAYEWLGDELFAGAGLSFLLLRAGCLAALDVPSEAERLLGFVRDNEAIKHFTPLRRESLNQQWNIQRLLIEGLQCRNDACRDEIRAKATALFGNVRAPIFLERKALRCGLEAMQRRGRSDRWQLRIHSEGHWAKIRGVRVDLSRRRVVRKLLLALCNHAISSPGEPLEAERLFELAWPDQQCDGRSLSKRLHSAAYDLRGLGIGKALVGSPLGYFLNPKDIRVQFDGEGRAIDAMPPPRARATG